ncbi:FAD-dependent oxidoreductase [Nonomuraea sp. NPDC046802]|uniref:FAD-dependent oxidoreductase n=1 Tax=Nonomuraea sp. NPDC046802 TaxID=3154919 RepID=UPI0033C1DD2D
MTTITTLPTPDFTFNADAPGACVAGVRPYRMGAYRLDSEQESGKFVVHNYGHGGAGITLSWGCADKVKQIVQTFLATSPETEVAVLGAGVMGMTAATRLLELGLNVTIFSDRDPIDTTSFRAGGQWAVSIIETAGKEDELKGIIKTAYNTFKGGIGKGWGVFERPNYSIRETPGLELVLDLVPGLLPPRQDVNPMPFQGHNMPGFEYQTLLVEPPTFIRRLKSDLDTKQVPFVNRHFTSKADVLGSLTQKIIINCTGLGAKDLWNDSDVIPVKGQLAMLNPQLNLQYLYGRNGQIFPRTDHVVIGGTVEPNVNNETPSKAKCKQLVHDIAAAFGVVVPAAPVKLPKWHIDHPGNERLVDPRLSIR